MREVFILKFHLKNEMMFITSSLQNTRICILLRMFAWFSVKQTRGICRENKEHDDVSFWKS